jgi:hypothetical protein
LGSAGWAASRRRCWADSCWHAAWPRLRLPERLPVRADRGGGYRAAGVSWQPAARSRCGGGCVVTNIFRRHGDRRRDRGLGQERQG